MESGTVHKLGKIKTKLGQNQYRIRKEETSSSNRKFIPSPVRGDQSINQLQ
jgi:hypothetical protein